MANSLLGPVTVNPNSVKLGQPVLVQVNDTKGKPYDGNSDVRITIQGVEATARYYQFSTPGPKQLSVRAVKDGIDEISVVTIQVTEDPMLFHLTLDKPSQTAMPIIQASLKLGSPYLVTFNLGTPLPAFPFLAKQIHPSPGVIPTKTAAVKAVSLTKTVAMGNTAMATHFESISKTLSALPPAKVTRIPVQTITSKDGVKITSSVMFGPLGAGGVHMTPMATRYTWDFGDGTTLTTQSPTATHDYFPAIQAQKVAHSFPVSCTIVHDNMTVTRTHVLISSYGVCKNLGTIVPYHTGDQFATFQQVAFSATMIVYNIEPQAITLDQMAVVPISDDPAIDPPAPQFVAMNSPITINPQSAMGIGVYVSTALESLGSKASGFTVYYTGHLVSAKPSSTPKPVTEVVDKALVQPIRIGILEQRVCFSRTFRIRLNDSRMIPTLNSSLIWDFGAALNGVTFVIQNQKAQVNILAGKQFIDQATNTVAIPLSSKANDVATQLQIRTAVQAGLAGISKKAGVANWKGTSPIGRPGP